VTAESDALAVQSATAAELRKRVAEIDADNLRLIKRLQSLLAAGGPMATTCFNWSQLDRFTEREQKMLKDMQVAWDEAATHG
jgi:hypothetical protein